MRGLDFSMKSKQNINTIHSGDYIYQALIKGLNKKQIQYVNDQIKKYGIDNIHIGLLRKVALTK